jgi:hypothetical protein
MNFAARNAATTIPGVMTTRCVVQLATCRATCGGRPIREGSDEMPQALRVPPMRSIRKAACPNGAERLTRWGASSAKRAATERVLPTKCYACYLTRAKCRSNFACRQCRRADGAACWIRVCSHQTIIPGRQFRRRYASRLAMRWAHMRWRCFAPDEDSRRVQNETVLTEIGRVDLSSRPRWALHR